VLWRGARAKALARLGRGAEAAEIAEKAIVLSQAIADESTRADALNRPGRSTTFSGLPAPAAAAALDLYEAKGNVVRVHTTRALLASLETATEARQASSTHHSETGGIPS